MPRFYFLEQDMELRDFFMHARTKDWKKKRIKKDWKKNKQYDIQPSLFVKLRLLREYGEGIYERKF